METYKQGWWQGSLWPGPYHTGIRQNRHQIAVQSLLTQCAYGAYGAYGAWNIGTCHDETCCYGVAWVHGLNGVHHWKTISLRHTVITICVTKGPEILPMSSKSSPFSPFSLSFWICFEIRIPPRIRALGRANGPRGILCKATALMIAKLACQVVMESYQATWSTSTCCTQYPAVAMSNSFDESTGDEKAFNCCRHHETKYLCRHPTCM